MTAIDESVRAALENQDLQAALREAVAIRSHEREVRIAAWVESALAPAGFRVEKTLLELGRPIIELRRGSGRPALLFHCHMDTVAPVAGWETDPFALTRKGARLHGLGAADAKGSMVAAIAAARALAEAGYPKRGTLAVLCVPAEEEAGRGTVARIERPVEADAAIVGEPTDNRPCVAHKGVYWIEVDVPGRSAHASQPEKGLNAIEGALKATDALARLATKLQERRHPLVGRATLAVTKLSGGQAFNVIPARCVVGLDRRAIPGERTEAIVEEIRATARAIDWPAQIGVRLHSFMEPSATDPSELIVQSALAGASAVLGEAVEPAGFTAACDMGALRGRCDIPTIILGPGHLDQAHKANEFIEEDSLRMGAEVYAATALEFFARAGESATAEQSPPPVS